MKLAAITLLGLLACREPTVSIGPDTTVAKRRAPEEHTIPVHAVTCAIAEFTCNERVMMSVPHVDIAKRCGIEDPADVTTVLDSWMANLHIHGCFLGVLEPTVP